MASYTMQLREYLESFSYNENLTTRETIEKGRSKLFDFDYPIFDLDYKKVFETHFIRTFYMREIGFETESLFKFNLETWLLVNMPYFNKLFESELKEFDPLSNTKIDVTQKKTNDKTSQTNSTTDGSGSSISDATGKNTKHQTSSNSDTQDEFTRRLQSDTPDGRLNLTSNKGEGVIEYASKINEDLDNTTRQTNGESDSTNDTTNHATVSDETNVTTSGNGTINETEDYIESKIGKIGNVSYSKMMMEYRESFLRIENKIFNEMQQLFMLVY